MGTSLKKKVKGEFVEIGDSKDPLFRGEWGPDTLVYAADLSSGLENYEGSRSGGFSGTRDDLPVVVSSSAPALADPPTAPWAAMMQVRNAGTAYFSNLRLDLSLLGLSNISRIRWKHAATVTSGTSPRMGALKNGVELSVEGPSGFPWKWAETEASEEDVIDWRARNLTNPNSSTDVRYYVSDIQVYVREDPYQLGEFVTYDRQMWKSLVVDNADTPGESASWELALMLPLVQGTTAERPDPVTAGSAFQYYDETLGKPIWSNGTAWTDASGVVV